jgi:hypothetical protein
MTATLIAIETAPPTPPAKRAERLHDAGRAAFEAVDEALHAADVLPRTYLGARGWTGSGAAATQAGLPGDRYDEWEAGCQLVDYLERRVARLERAIRVIAESDHVLNEDQRRELLSGVYGPAMAARRRAVLSETERELVDHYRGMDAPGRQMLRTLCARLGSGQVSER